MIGFDFFTWIREGVRRSVLMGVADACDTLGTHPGENETDGSMSRRITSYLQGDDSQRPTRASLTAGGGGTSRRKLGRGLTVEIPPATDGKS